MITLLISTLLTAIFLFLSGLHFYWALGGKWANNKVIPTNTEGEKLFIPSITASIMVGLTLLSFGILILARVFYWQTSQPISNFLLVYGLWVVAGIFTLRAIGDFNYVGFFKKVKQTPFAKNDTKYYSPLCLFIAVLTVVLELVG